MGTNSAIDGIDFDIPCTAQRTARRACAACQASYVVPLDYDGPPLCDGCRADIPATRARVKAWLGGVLGQIDAVLNTWEAVRRQHSALWAKLETAMIELSEAELQTRWAARYHGPDERWRVLLKAYEDREVALAPLATERKRLEAALGVIDEPLR